MANPILAAIISFLIPGIGQMYAGDIKRGAIFLVIAIVILLIRNFANPIIGIAFLIIGIIFMIYSAYDAYKLASA